MSRARFSPPLGPLNVVLDVPGSKSVANRALVCAMLANGVSHIHGVPDGDDTTVIVRVLQEMSAVTIFQDIHKVKGNPQAVLPGIVDAQLAGTSSRFLTAVAALSSSSFTVIDGSLPLRSRPMGELHEALVQLGATLESLGEPGHLPVSVCGSEMSGGHITMQANVSSQFISALMLIGPYLPGGLVIELTGPQVSGSYIAMTANVMACFGVDVEMTQNKIEIPEAIYKSCDFVIEPDFSSAAFPIVAVLLRGGQVRIRNLALSMQQGDAAILDIAHKMGASWTQVDNDIVVSCVSNAFVPTLSLAMSDCSDLVPAVAVAMSHCVGEGDITQVGFIRNKESDRLGDLAAELSKTGSAVNVHDDGISVRRRTSTHPDVLLTHHDHRLAMSFALLSLLDSSICIDSPEVVSKSWPSYYTDMFDILGTVNFEN